MLLTRISSGYKEYVDNFFIGFYFLYIPYIANCLVYKQRLGVECFSMLPRNSFEVGKNVYTIDATRKKFLGGEGARIVSEVQTLIIYISK